MQAAAVAGDKVKKNGKDAPGATDDPADLSDEKMSVNGNGHRDGPVIIQKFYNQDQPRDKDGKWTDGGGGGTAVAESTMTDLDKKIIDYKPDQRPLSDPSKLTSITKILPESRYVSYSKMPFFRALSAMHGVPDPEKIDGATYKKLRDELFATKRHDGSDIAPVEDIPFNKLAVTQGGVNKDKLAKMAESPAGIGDFGTELGPIQVARYNGENYILNGHHRLVSEYQKGAKTMKARVLTITDDEIKAYESSARAKPQLDKMLTEVAAAHGAMTQLAPLKSLKRARDKVEGDYGGDWSQVKDIVRGRILTHTDKQSDIIADDLRKRLGNSEEKFTDHKESGFRDYKFRPVIEGRKVEIAIVHKEIAKATELTHQLYEKAQVIERNARKLKRALNAMELEEITTLNNNMKYIFQQARASAA